MDELMRSIGYGIETTIEDYCGTKKGFALIVFEFGQPGISNYISNGDRADMIKTLRETADRLEKNQDMPPVHPTIQ